MLEPKVYVALKGATVQENTIVVDTGFLKNNQWLKNQIDSALHTIGGIWNAKESCYRFDANANVAELLATLLIN